MSRRVGFKTISHSWKDPFYRKPPKPMAIARTPEQIAEAEDKRKDMMRGFGRQLGVPEADLEVFAAGNGAYRDLLDEREAQARALTKIADREARVAVEGDTDLNHDNVEAAE